MLRGERLVSLDVFRGITMAAMVIVNNPGDWGHVYPPLLHAEWHGWTPTDLIFPFFLFIVGVSLTLSRTSAGWGSLLRRAAIICALGLFLAGFPRFEMDRWRIPGVLQRIALCYLAAAALFKATAGDRRRQAWTAAIAAALLALGYWAVMMLVPAPGGVAGDLTPEGNLGAWIDRRLLDGHLWKPRWDPEGLLSTIPAITTTLLGLLAGLGLTGPWPARRKSLAIGCGGLAAIAVGLLWDAAFPINKNLWTSSYAVFTAGCAAGLLAALYALIDAGGHRRGTGPLVILGRNAITLFVASGILVKTLNWWQVDGVDGREIAASRWLYETAFQPFAAPRNASLLYAVANLVVLFALLWWMHRRRLYLRV